ncbi:geranylgeranyl transferase type I beta subunit, putative [Entamoeba dispar SAW760]|uniref:Geranylgeranyl transferase type I beta subunit, putative n=1 Tax=Entamoeba dispar (strain ATCC PRA-260 / SAW760) TaxID=370354 RepID=B0EHD4_ENTDS|nr:geranylgeranyl transferase type I beta subunit, putative [Entamoeba dispar SAW760]EDR26063.1 geranylgeranyl transferase type I beta subunit, putative [Entamoeba dispar SAW760]|eukprot:EDR26063.1 geranylgeranyl transferase type I beta subunit, putative [Entamoeba dispar SAW760]
MNSPNLRSEGLTQESLKLTQNFIIRGLTQPLPDAFQNVEIGRITMIMFYLGAYKILFPEQPINKVIDTEKTIQYILTSLSIKSEEKEVFQGFTGCEMYGIFKHGHISYTYAALASLSQLGYDLRRIDKSKIVNSYHTLFRKEYKGVFATSLEEEGEYDIRFIYSLCATCYLLNDWGNINKEILFEFIMNCRSYDFAFGQMPKRESHGGSTYSFTENCVSKRFGGISKNQEAMPDPMHTFCSLTGLSLIGALPVKYTIDSRIGIEKPSYL